MDYQKHYDVLINRSKSRILEGYSEKHHIIPKCMGGTNDKENISILTPEEHYLAHQLLVKIYPNIKGLIVAAIRLSGKGNSYRKCNNKLYGWLRRKHSEMLAGNSWGNHTKETKKKISESNKGKHNFTHTQETKDKISEAGIGRPSGMLDKHHTEEHNKEMSKRFKGRDGKPSTQKGIPKSEETKKKMAESQKARDRTGIVPHNKGIPMTETAKKNMGDKNSENLKGRTWEDIYGIEGAADRRKSQAAKKEKNSKLKQMAKEGGSN